MTLKNDQTPARFSSSRTPALHTHLSTQNMIVGPSGVSIHRCSWRLAMNYGLHRGFEQGSGVFYLKLEEKWALTLADLVSFFFPTKFSDQHPPSRRIWSQKTSIHASAPGFFFKSKPWSSLYFQNVAAGNYGRCDTNLHVFGGPYYSERWILSVDLTHRLTLFLVASLLILTNPVGAEDDEEEEKG